MTGLEANTAAPATTFGAVTSDAGIKVEPLTLLAALLGFFSFAVILSAYHIADGDLWAKLAIGASVWLRGEVPREDSFAFTPTLPKYIDHEWGAGTLFYGLLQCFGPAALMVLKIVLFFGAILFAVAVARKAKVNWTTTLLLALPAAWTVLPAYVPTLRAHTFTFFFFSALLLALEEVRSGNRKAAFFVPVLIWFWANLHGGVAAGLGTIAVYTAEALLRTKSRNAVGPQPQQVETRGAIGPSKPLAPSLPLPLGTNRGPHGAIIMLAVAIGSFAVTFLNPYGVDYWRYLIPALLHPRPRIAEWQPLPLWQIDFYLGFRLLCVIVVAGLLLGWRGRSRSWSGLAMLLISGFLGWRSQRHAPFFGVAALAFAGPFVEGAGANLRSRWRTIANFQFSIFNSQFFNNRRTNAAVVVVVYLTTALFVAAKFLPNASWEILAPVGHDPVREADILSRSEAHGNLAVPFGWGSYASWRLFPRVKISHDGRYEAAYPEATFELNNDFFEKRGPKWDRLIRNWSVDYVILDLQHERLRPEDLREHGYELIWLDPNKSALMALSKHAGNLGKVAGELPPTTINPLDPSIPRRWFGK